MRYWLLRQLNTVTGNNCLIILKQVNVSLNYIIKYMVITMKITQLVHKIFFKGKQKMLTISIFWYKNKLEVTLFFFLD